MSTDLHAALTALVDDWSSRDDGWFEPVREVLDLLAAHPATDADLIREAEQRGAAAVVERVEAVVRQWQLNADELEQEGRLASANLLRSRRAEVRAAVRATEGD